MHPSVFLSDNGKGFIPKMISQLWTHTFKHFFYMLRRVIISLWSKLIYNNVYKIWAPYVDLKKTEVF